MRWILSLPALLLLGWGMAGLLWWHARSRANFEPLVPWAMTGMACISVAMALLLATLPAPLTDQIVRAALLIEGVAGLWILRRRAPEGSRNGRR
ncbi:MAG: hypothetical protein LAO05_04725 [Acidobacteriia bacterium]|nr:hypothetical protein [Terriglobia bacterium]